MLDRAKPATILRYIAVKSKKKMKNTGPKKCPKCPDGLLKDRAKRSFAVKYLLFWLPIKRYKCNTCHKKTYKFGSYPHKKLVWA